MLLDFSWTELMLIGVVALVVIGPKDLPKALRVAGFWVRKARTLSREFQSSVEQMVREAELDEVRQQLEKASAIDIDKEFRRTIDPAGTLAENLKPPELPNFSEPATAAPNPAAPAMTETTMFEPPGPEPVAPATQPAAPGDGAVHDIASTRP